MDTSTSTESATPSTITQKPSALSSLLEFGTLPPSSNIGDVRPTGAPTIPFPFPFVTPGPGVPFSPQAAAGMTTYYRPSFGVPSTTTPMDINPQTFASPPSQPAPKSTKSKKKSASKTNLTEVIAQNILDELSPPKKKARKTNPRGKGKAKKNETDGENVVDEDNKSPPPPTTTKTKKTKKLKKDTKDKTTGDDPNEPKATNGPPNNTSHLLAQMGLMNNPLMQSTPPTPLLQSSSSNNNTTPTPNAQQQQAQIAAMYNMAPHFAAYNTFPGAFNPSFPGSAYSGGYPPPYGFHPAFSNAPPGQPFPFMPPTPTSTASSINKYVFFPFRFIFISTLFSVLVHPHQFLRQYHHRLRQAINQRRLLCLKHDHQNHEVKVIRVVKRKNQLLLEEVRKKQHWLLLLLQHQQLKAMKRPQYPQLHPLKRQRRLLQHQNQHRHLHHRQLNDELVVQKVKILMSKMMNNNNPKQQMVNRVMNQMVPLVPLIVHRTLYHQHLQHQKRKVDVRR
jgi:hypothetical protein